MKNVDYKDSLKFTTYGRKSDFVFLSNHTIYTMTGVTPSFKREEKSNIDGIIGWGVNTIDKENILNYYYFIDTQENLTKFIMKFS